MSESYIVSQIPWIILNIALAIIVVTYAVRKQTSNAILMAIGGIVHVIAMLFSSAVVTYSTTVSETGFGGMTTLLVGSNAFSIIGFIIFVIGLGLVLLGKSPEKKEKEVNLNRFN